MNQIDTSISDLETRLRMTDTEMVLRSSVMKASLKGYTQVKLRGKNQGLDGHRDVLRSRFSRVTATPEEAVPEAAECRGVTDGGRAVSGKERGAAGMRLFSCVRVGAGGDDGRAVRGNG